VPDSFGQSIAAGEERGRRLARLDAAVAVFQSQFLGLCGEFLERMKSLDAGTRAFFNLYCVIPGGGGQVSVYDDGRVTFHRHGTSSELSGTPLTFARTLLGSYETEYQEASDIEEAATGILASAEQTMSMVLEERAALRTRNQAAASGE